MHVYFSGIGGSGIGPLALIAHQAGWQVSGSDKQDSAYIAYLKKHGIDNIHIGQDGTHLAETHQQSPIDWFVYSSALVMEQPNSPELKFCHEQNIKATKRDEFLSGFLQKHQLKLIAIAGTHGKTTTTAMTIWLMKQLGVPISYSVGAKLGFGEMGEFDSKSEYFVYEADEFDRNFLAFHPHVSIIAGLDWDHPDIYPTRDEYNEAFMQFVGQSHQTILWDEDARKLGNLPPGTIVLEDEDPLLEHIKLAGEVNRKDALLAAYAVRSVTHKDLSMLLGMFESFPGLSRRFERLAKNIYTDYAHTPPKIRGALQLAYETAGKNVVVVYEGLHNTRQHFIKHELADLFVNVKKLYVVPTYLAREDKSLALLQPEDIKSLLNPATQAHTQTAQLDDQFAETLRHHARNDELVLCITAGGGNSLDEWLRKKIADTK